MGLLACKKLKGEDKPPAAEATAASESAPEPSDPTDDDSDETSDTAELPGVTAIGATAQLKGLTVQVAEVRECKYERERSQTALDKKQQKIVGLLVYFEGDYADAEIRALAHTWKAYDGEGITYKPASIHATDCKPPAKTMRLAKGDKAKGWVGFTVPTSTKVLTAKYKHRIPVQAAKESANQRVTFQVLGN